MLAVTLEKIYLIISHMKCGFDFLLRQSLLPSSSSCSCSPHVLHVIDAHTVRETVCISDPNDAAEDSSECAVCLCRIGGGEEIRRLRCSHVFHRACFDRWIGHGRWICPLCRNHVANIPTVNAGDIRREILVFNFAEISSSENKDAWWLR